MWLKIILWFIAIMISFLLFDLSCMLINAASDFENILAVLPIAVILSETQIKAFIKIREKIDIANKEYIKAKQKLNDLLEDKAYTNISEQINSEVDGGAEQFLLGRYDDEDGKDINFHNASLDNIEIKKLKTLLKIK